MIKISELKELIELILTGAPWIIFPIIIIYFLFNPDKVEKWAALLSRLFSSASKKMEKVYISKDIQYKINSFRKIVNKECQDLIPYKTEIKFVNLASFKGEKYEHKGNRFIMILKDKKNQDENLVRAALRSTENTLIPNSRRYIEPKLMRSIDLEFVKNLIKLNDKSKLNYYIDNCLGPEVKNDTRLEENLRILEGLSERGVFTRILLQELKDYGILFYPELNTENHYKEPNEFFKKLEELAQKKHNIDIKPNYSGKYIKVGIVMIGRSVTLFKPKGIDISAYMNYIFKCEDEGIRIIYLLAWNRNIFAAKKISETLNLIPDRFQKISDSNYNVKRQDYTLVANCIRYLVLKNF